MENILGWELKKKSHYYAWVQASIGSLGTYPLEIRWGYCSVLNTLYATTPWILTLSFEVVSINYLHFPSGEGLQCPAVWTNKLLPRDKWANNKKYFIALESARGWRHLLTHVTGDCWRSLPGTRPSPQRLHTGSGLSQHPVGKETFLFHDFECNSKIWEQWRKRLLLLQGDLPGRYVPCCLTFIAVLFSDTSASLDYAEKFCQKDILKVTLILSIWI